MSTKISQQATILLHFRALVKGKIGHPKGPEIGSKGRTKGYDNGYKSQNSGKSEVFVQIGPCKCLICMCLRFVIWNVSRLGQTVEFERIGRLCGDRARVLREGGKVSHASASRIFDFPAPILHEIPCMCAFRPILGLVRLRMCDCA